MTAILSIADPSIAEAVLAELRGIDDDVDVVPYIGGSLRRKRYELVVVASHVSGRGVHLAGDNYLSPMALGSLADSAKARTVYVAYCDATIANEIAGGAKSATIVYYGAALDGATAQRLATSFAERYVCEGVESAIDAARATGCNVLGAVWKMPEQTSGGLGVNPEFTKLLLDLQREASQTAADVRYLRQDMETVKSDIRELRNGGGSYAFQAARAQLAVTPTAVMVSIFAVVILAASVAWLIARAAGV